jgi:hypothetical protein
MEAARGLNSLRKRSSIVKSTLVYFLASKRPRKWTIFLQRKSSRFTAT